MVALGWWYVSVAVSNQCAAHGDAVSTSKSRVMSVVLVLEGRVDPVGGATVCAARVATKLGGRSRSKGLQRSMFKRKTGVEGKAERYSHSKARLDREQALRLVVEEQDYTRWVERVKVAVALPS